MRGPIKARLVLLDEVVQREVDRDRLAREDRVTGPRDREKLGVRRCRHCLPVCTRAHLVTVTVDGESWAAYPLGQREQRARAKQRDRLAGANWTLPHRYRRLDVRIEGVTDEILDLLRGVRIGLAVRSHEPIEEAGIVLAPEVAVELSPPEVDPRS